jgi:hypothetical protein
LKKKKNMAAASTMNSITKTKVNNYEHMDKHDSKAT